ncbi:potassium transporter KtrB [Metamycoplasma hominis]|uniref:TrkH family potassium uptake protein n=1 Tax=Metamycoplasma hominis TaxID=2098 RepID=UPI001F40C813|nr:potassium transporter TrkG [Metamycoplasma hominis]UIU37773.1 potassium transporter KtrB [Metamycoplasma hominis]
MIKKGNPKKSNVLFVFLKKLGTIRFIFLIYILFTILMSLMLYWEVSHNPSKHISYLDALLLAASSFTTTGLSGVAVSEVFNMFGQILIAVCFILGGIGIFTFKLYIFQSLLGLRTNLFSGQIHQTERGGSNIYETKKMIKVSISFLIIISILFSLIFSLIFYYDNTALFSDEKMSQLNAISKNNPWTFNPYEESIRNPYHNFGMSLRFGIFHTLSAINNAGLDIIGTKSLQPYYHNYYFLFLTSILFLIGGMGFPVFYDVWQKIKSIKKDNPRHCFTLFTKFTIITYIFTSLIGLLLTFIFETTAKGANYFWNSSEYGSIGDKVFAIYFQTMSTRSAGFSTVNYYNFTQPTIMVHGILMFIGFSPVSTAGGIRNITVAIIFMSIITLIKNRKNINAFHRQIGKESLIKAVNIFAIAVFITLIMTIVIYHTLPSDLKNVYNESYPMVYVMFEVFSAFGNSGLNIGLTPNLGITGKILLIITMIVGQLGISQFLKIFTFSKSKPQRYQYIYEDISMG